MDQNNQSAEKHFQLYKRYERFAWERGMADFRPLKPLILEMLSELSTELTGQERSDGECDICGKLTRSLHGNPFLWPLLFPKPDGTGVCRHWHVGCIIDSLSQLDSLRSQHAQELAQLRVTADTYKVEGEKAAALLTEELAKVSEELAVAKSQVENDDINLEQVRIALESKHRTTLSAVEAERDALKERAEKAERLHAELVNVIRKL